MTSLILKLSEVEDLKGCSLAYGHFTTIHPGHIRYLKYAKTLGEELVVAIIGDGAESKEPRYQFNQNERSEALAMLDIAKVIIKLDDQELLDVLIL